MIPSICGSCAIRAARAEPPRSTVTTGSSTRLSPPIRSSRAIATLLNAPLIWTRAGKLDSEVIGLSLKYCAAIQGNRAHGRTAIDRQPGGFAVNERA